MATKIPQTNPGAGYRAHQAEIDAAIQEALGSGWYILGRQTAAFEQEFAGYLGVRRVIGVGNGTDALHLSLRTCGIGPGDGVVTVSHTAVATVAAIELAGAVPILVDIDPASYTMDPESLEQALRAGEQGRLPNFTGRIKAVIPVHLYGHPADMDAILALAGKYELFVIEDCAQSHGATWQGRKTGTFGHLAAFSFYPTKNLGALGDGGAVAANDDGLAERAKALREYGWQKRYISEFAGMNTRLDEMQSALLRVKLRYLDSDNIARREVARQYAEELDGGLLQLPVTGKGAEHVFHQYVVRVSQRESFQKHLMSQGIGTAIHYPVPVHRQPAYLGRVSVEPEGLPETEKAAPEIVSLPMFPQLKPESAKAVVNAIKEWAGKPPNQPDRTNPTQRKPYE